MGISIERTYSNFDVERILKTPGLWELISEDEQDIRKFSVDASLTDFYYLKVMFDGVCLGLYVLHPFNDITMEIHANMLPEFREKYANASAEKVLEWIAVHLPPKKQKIIARIPSVFPNIYHFTLKHGFSDEGLLKNATIKNRELCDVHIVGIERKSIKVGD